MKAIQYTAFGGPEVIKLNEVEKPTPSENEVLIKTLAVTVNPFDIKVRTGKMQPYFPVDLPYTPGTDVSGIIEAVGANVQRLKPGDEVFGSTYGGTYAQYVLINENQVALKPRNVTAAEAAALAVPIVTAYTILKEAGDLQAGQRVLVHGAAGGVGTVVVQMAKALGAYVIATASGDGLEIAHSMGADEVIDYKTQDFTKLAHNIDLVSDPVGGETQTKSFEVLKRGGKLLSIVSQPSQELAEKYGVTIEYLNSAPSHIKLEFGSKLVEEGKIQTHIAETMKLADAARAQELLSAGGVNGKIVLVLS